ncbi:cathepsin O-like [Sitodiplosis mosellana]|uniref:cathepsin O-like n=1 Tax=Sitodiplosis mosellana TaxID=263140 RepID=UPI002444A770|nr:cathepsin O-like [Sitodiplosis mosellana]
MKCSKGLWIFVLLILLLFLAIPLHIGVLRIRIPQHLAEELFKNFTAKYNKTYINPEEFQKRLGIFKTTLENIIRLNTAENATAHFGVTRYSDLTPEEFEAIHLNRNMSHIIGARLKSIQQTPLKNVNSTIKVNEVKYEFTDNNEFDRYPSFYKQNLLEQNVNFIPMKVDWRKENVLRPVRLQGKCGACYAFSVIEMIEAHLKIHKNLTKTLSVQQMIDCAENENRGCDGGDSCLLLEWLVEDRIKILTDREYPRSKDGMNQTCHILLNDPTMEGYRVTDYTCSSFIGNENVILEIVANYGPVVAAVNASPWQHFLSGIIQHECDSSAEDVNHAVLIVGFDRSGPTPYYILQNTWGDQFADNGFVKIAIGNNTCGIATQISLAKL